MANKNSTKLVYNDVAKKVSQTIREIRSEFLEKVDHKSIFDFFSNDIYKDTNIPIDDFLTFLLFNDLITFVLIYDDLDFDISISSYKLTALIRKMEEKLVLNPLPEEIVHLYGILQDLNPDLCSDVFILIEKHNSNRKYYDDDLGEILQSLLPTKMRKKFAAHFTFSDISRFITQLIPFTIEDKIIDPFVGSGRLLAASLEEITKYIVNEGIEEEKLDLLISGIDIFPISTRLAKCQLLIQLSRKKLMKHQKKISLITDDTFRRFKRKDNSLSKFLEDKNVKTGKDVTNYDLVIMNPPYTRYNLLPKFYRVFLDKRFIQYKTFFGKHAGLHIYAIFLADELLNDEGRIAAVLPASIIFSSYSENFKKFLLRKYHIEFIITSETEKAFSDQSNFREIILICRKRTLTSKKLKESELTKFILLKCDVKTAISNIIAQRIIQTKLGEFNPDYHLNILSRESLMQSWNWMKYFHPSNVLTLNNQILSSKLLYPGKKLPIRLIRGVEMYGPEFFFLPNKFFKIVESTNDSVIIENTEEDLILTIPKIFLEKSLRKPGLYQNQITPKIREWVFSIPLTSALSKDMEKYLSLSSKNLPAKKSFGERWFSHIYDQISKKEPWGRIFIPDKTSLASTSVIAHYTNEIVTCSKNFYILSSKNSEYEKFLAIWFNSSIFLSRYLIERREIGGSFGRLQIVDYNTQKLLPHPSIIKNADLSTLFAVFDEIRVKKMPSILEQRSSNIKYELDEELIRILQNSMRLDIDLETIISSVNTCLDSFSLRD